jgi:hypothetical protein
VPKRQKTVKIKAIESSDRSGLCQLLGQRMQSHRIKNGCRPEMQD